MENKYYSSENIRVAKCDVEVYLKIDLQNM